MALPQIQIKEYQPTDHKIKALIYGAAGSGKTVFAGTAPNVIFASAEGGLLSIADKKPSFVDVKTYKDLTDLLHYLKNEKHDYATLVIDSITEINDIIKAEIEQRTGKRMQIQDWGELFSKMKAVFRAFRNLPMHVIFIALESVESDEGKVEKIVPSLNGKAASEISAYMDIVGYVFVEGDGTRKIITTSNKRYLTKDRSNQIGNDPEMDFAKWIEKVAKMQTGEQKVKAEYSAPVETGKKLPVPQRREQITKEQTDRIFYLWPRICSTEDPAQSDAQRTKTLIKNFKVDSTTKLSKEQAAQFILALEKKYAAIEEGKAKDTAQKAAEIMGGEIIGEGDKQEIQVDVMGEGQSDVLADDKPWKKNPKTGGKAKLPPPEPSESIKGETSGATAMTCEEHPKGCPYDAHYPKDSK